MRILILTSVYPRPGREAAAPFNRLQFRALADAGHDVTVVAPVVWIDALRRRLAGRPNPHRYRVEGGVEVLHPTYFYPPKVLRHLYGHFYLASVRAAVRRAIAERRPDVVLGCFVHPDGWAAVRLAREAGLPVVVKVIGSDVLVTGKPGSARYRWVAEAAREADALVTVSRDLADHVVAMGADPRRVHVIHEGLDMDVFRPGDRGAARSRLGLPAAGRVVLFVGNVLLSKGAGVLVEACARLAAAGEEFTCYVVGHGRDEQRVRALASRLGMSGRVVLAGSRPHHELADWYRASDVVALPSFSEGIPNVLREASACGRPYVATDVGGIPEITGPDSGLLVPPGDPDALADALRVVLAAGLPGAAPSPSPVYVPIDWKESARRVADVLTQAVSATKSCGPARKQPTPATSPPVPDEAAGQPAGVPPPMRILVITTLYPRPGREAAAPFNRLQFRALADAGHDVTVVAPVVWIDALRRRLAGRPNPHRYRVEGGVEVLHPTYFYPPKVLRHLYGHFYLASVRAAVRRAIAERRPDVVLGCFVHPDGWAAVRLAREAGLPVVVKSHGSSVLVAVQEGDSRRRRVAEAVCGADSVVAVGRDLADHILALGADPRKVHVVHNGIDTKIFHPGDRREARARLGLALDRRVVLFVGNILLSKGAGVLVEACARLAAAGEEFTCYLMGRGRDEARVHSQVERLGMSGRVVLAGSRPHHELADWYRASDVVALPSFSEGIPNVLREASACGRPYVATDVGGIPEITGPDSGLLVPPGDPDALADALRKLLTRLPSEQPVESGATASSWEESASRLAGHLWDAVRAFRAVDAVPHLGAEDSGPGVVAAEDSGPGVVAAAATDGRQALDLEHP